MRETSHYSTSGVNPLWKSFPTRCLASCLAFVLILPASPVQAYWVWSPESGKFVQPEGAVEDTADQQYDYALGFYEAQNYGKAVEELKNLLKKYPASKVAPEAQFRLGSIYEEQNEFYKAFQAYQRIADNYPNSARMNEVIERQFRIGNVFLSGKKPKFMGVPVLPAVPRAIEVFEQVVKNAPFGAYGDKALFQLAVAYRRSGTLQKAVETFQNLVDNYPDSALVPDAKYQLGEVSYEMTKNMTRSQEGLESAEDYFDSFLAEYPSTNVREKALQLKKAIDEKNAEKNYKVGEYYEKENYLDSAIIYYEDIVRAYPDTAWAAKAREKLAIFRSPVKFVREKEDALETELARVALREKETQESLRALPESARLKRGKLESDLKLLERKEKELKASVRSFGRRKVSDIRRREEALKRKESELKEKRKTLERKKRLLRDNPSEDLERAFRNWSESLRAEELAFRRERAEMARVAQELGVPAGLRLPFTRPESLEDLRQMHVEDLSELMNEKKMWGLRKEELYEFRAEVLTHLDQLRAEDLKVLFRKKEFQKLLAEHGGDLRQRVLALDRQEARLEALREQLVLKERSLRKIQGKGRWSGILSTPQRAVRRSLRVMPFSGTTPEERRKEARKKDRELARTIADKRAIIEAIHRSFEKELGGRFARGAKSREKKEDRVSARLSAELRLKRRMKLVEREIRWRYEEIQDRNQVKRRKMDELDALIQTLKSQRTGFLKAGGVVTAPARGTYRFFHAFLFGLKPREEVIRQESLAAQSHGSYEKDRERVRSMREEIELESILIEARAREIENLKQDLEALKKKASRRKGFSYRSVFIERPGTFLEDVVSSAKRILPRKERREILIDRLDRETRRVKGLEEERRTLRAQLREIEAEIGEESAQVPAEEPARPEKAGPDRSRKISRLEREARELETKIARREKSYERKRRSTHEELKTFYRERFQKRLEERFGFDDRNLQEKKKLYDKERKKAEEEILEILKKEEKIVRKVEGLLLEKKKKIKKKITDFKASEDYRHEVLENELAELLDQSRQVRMERQSLLEERKRVSENLKSEVVSFET